MLIPKPIGAPRQTVYRWKAVLEAEGIDALRDMSKGGENCAGLKAGAIIFRIAVSRIPQVEADFSPDEAGFEMTG